MVFIFRTSRAASSWSSWFMQIASTHRGTGAILVLMCSRASYRVDVIIISLLSMNIVLFDVESPQTYDRARKGCLGQARDSVALRSKRNKRQWISPLPLSYCG